MDNPNRKGAIAEAMVTAQAVLLGIEVLKPVSEHGRYDLAFDLGARILRVQCKWGALDRSLGAICVRTGGSRLTPRGYVRSTYRAEEVDAIAVYCPDYEQILLVPIEIVAGKKSLHLRVRKPGNSQRACINLASRYHLGAIAQLGERSAGSRKVVGSSPTSSTPRADDVVQVGAHEFRNLFGHFMERASAGEEITITHRGKPRARLGPA